MVPAEWLWQKLVVQNEGGSGGEEESGPTRLEEAGVNGRGVWAVAADTASVKTGALDRGTLQHINQKKRSKSNSYSLSI